MEEHSHHSNRRTVKLTLKLPSNKVLIVMVIVVLAIASLVFVLTKQQHNAVGPGKPLPREARALLDELGEKMELPQGEVPTMATVTDVAKLDTQPFFRHAKDGDSIIIYATSKKAILYRLSTHKIIEVAPINISDDIKNLQGK